MANVFISSTGLDLSEYRACAIEVCNRLGLVPVAMEFFEAMGAGASAGSLTKLESADVYVGIVAHRYGYIEAGSTVSVTELEFEHAGVRGLERLCFLLKPDFPWPPSSMDHAHLEQLSRFRSKVEQEVIRHEFTTVDDFKAKLIQSLSEWQKRCADPAALDSILDLFATHRAFFKGDDRALAHILRMLDYSDAGRALAVAHSLAESATEIQRSLGQLRSTRRASLKDSLARLIVACKDYAERYGRVNAGILALPHIGWGQRLDDFTASDSQFGFTSTDSVETFKQFVEYLSRSFRDLLHVRVLAQAAVSRIADAEPTLNERCGAVQSLISEGEEYLRKAVADLEHGARVVGEILASAEDFEARRTSAAARAQTETNETVARLLVAVSKIRRPQAWTRGGTARP